MVFFTDIDNTLIFSEKLAPKNSVCVEYKDNKPLTFMSKKSIELYKELCSKILVVPITTRSTEQFMRIKNINNTRYAIVANGAKLLVNGNENRSWSKNFIPYVNSFKDTFDKCRNILTNNFPDCCIRMADDAFMYSKLDDNTHKAFKILSKSCTEDHVNIIESHGKIYVIPKKVCKENAITYFYKKYNIDDISISAGDSLMDMNMLLSTNIAFIMNGELKDKFKNRNCKNIIFTHSYNDTEFVLETVLSYLKN